MGKKKRGAEENRIAAQNRKARHEYEILETCEAGICLLGTEVKSLRAGRATIADSYAELRKQHGETALWLVNSTIPEYREAGLSNHDPQRPRKLLLHRREIKKLGGRIETKGMTLVPLSIYFNRKGLAKVQLALVRGKTKYDKREAEKKRDWNREKLRLLRGKS